MELSEIMIANGRVVDVMSDDDGQTVDMDQVPGVSGCLGPAHDHWCVH